MSKRKNVIVAVILFLGVTAQSYAQEKGPGAPPAFSSVDLDGNGEVNFEEFSQQKLPGGDPKEVFDSIDSNDDEIITEQEFIDHKPPPPPRR